MRVPLLWLALAAVVSAQDGRGFFADEGCAKHCAPLRSYDVLHYTLEIAFDLPARHIAGTVHIRMKSLQPALRLVTLHCGDLDVKRVTDPQGRELTFKHDVDRLVVSLAEPVAPDAETTVSVTYEGSPRKGIYWVVPDAAYPNRPAHAYTQGEPEETRSWLPCWDYPNDKATSEVFATVGAGLMALSNGNLVEVKAGDNGARTFHWMEAVPHASYLISIAVGDYEEFDLDSDGLKIVVYAPKGLADRAAIDRSFKNTADMIHFYSEKIGVPYPYEKYGQVLVQQFRWSGMENISLTTLTADTLMDEGTATESRSDWLVAHELAHQWWGDLLTCRDWSHIWLNEGFASYFEALYTEHHFSEDEFLWEMNDTLGSATWEDSDRYRRPIVCATYAEAEDLFDSTTYSKGAWVLHMLRSMLGDEVFWKAIHLYCDRNREKMVGTDDLQAAFGEASGQDLGWFWDQWVNKGGFPDFKVDWSWDEANKCVRLHVKQTQGLNDFTPLFRCPLDVALCLEKERKTVHLSCDQQDATWMLPCEAKPATVLFDVGHRIAKRLDFGKSKEEWIWTLANVEDPVERLRALRGLKDAFAAGDAGAIDAIAKVFASDKLYKLRQIACDVMAETKTGKAEELLLGAAKDADARVRHSVTNGMGNFGDEKALAALKDALANDAVSDIRASALDGLVKNHAKDAWETVVAGLATASHHDAVARQAVSGIADLGRPDSLEFVMNLAQYGSSPWVRDTAIRCLGRVGKGNPEVTAYLVKVLEGDLVHGARRAAFDVLNDWSAAEARPVLEKMIASEPDARFRRDARTFWRRLHEGDPAKQAEKKRADAAQKERDAIARESEGKQKRAEAEQLRAQAEQLRKEADLLAPPK